MCRKKVLIFLLVGIANILDVQVIGSGSVLRTAVIFFYISNEGVSLLEGLMPHSVGCPPPKASVFINPWNSLSHDSSCVHGFVSRDALKNAGIDPAIQVCYEGMCGICGVDWVERKPCFLYTNLIRC